MDHFLDQDSYGPGLITVHHEGLPIDIRHDPRGFPTTTVFFNAAITNPKLRYPFFSGVGISELLPTDRIHVHDPSLYLDDDLKLAWYAGSRKQNLLQEVLPQILLALLPAGQRVVTSGSSGGGFAALYYGTKLPHATAVPVNPQTSIARYNPRIVARYAELAWGVTGGDPVSRIPAQLDLVEIYRGPVQNRTWYIQNTGDASHVDEHMRPFLESAHADNDVEAIFVDAGTGHVPPPKEFVTKVLAAAVDGSLTPPRA